MASPEREGQMTQEIEIRVDNGVQIIRLVRADKKNALTGPMYDAMSAALEEAERSDAIAAHVFLGSGGLFTAGNDINDFVRRAQDGSQHAAPSQMFIGRLPKVTRPMIAAVDGLAVGIGVTLLLHCDLVYATPTASFRAPFVDLGLIQEAGSSLLGPARLGYARAFELLALGEVWTADRAALLAARRMLKGDPALASKAIADELAVYKDLIRSPEAREAFTAFLEKRAPDFAKARRGAA